jgi:hypothetical protein
MTATERTTRRKPSRTASIPTLEGLARAGKIIGLAQRQAFERGKLDFENSTRDHPPYGFSDLQQAWRLGWLAGKQKKEGLNGASRASFDGKSAQ